jgi:acetyl-CoA C-acetyltransferase
MRKSAQIGLAGTRRIAVLGGAGAEDAWHSVEKLSYVQSPALDAVLRGALEASALGANACDLFDFYSCFPCAIELALEALGIEAMDHRPFTATGGLAYAGGPGNEYTLHAFASSIEALRQGPARTALITGLGMAASKFAATVISNDPARVAAAAGAALFRVDCNSDGPRVADAADGPARVDTYTIEYDREGRPSRSILMLRLPDGARTVANGPATAAFHAELFAREPIGREGHVRHDLGTRLNQFDWPD